MKNIYDNGHKLLGVVADIVQLIENGLDKGIIADDDVLEIYKTLKTLNQQSIVMIDYDRPMYYDIVEWKTRDLMQEGV